MKHGFSSVSRSTGPAAQAAWPPSDAEIWQALQTAWADGSWGKYEGRFGAQLCAALAEIHQRKFVLTCCSGTFAVELALRGLAVAPGDEVVLAAYDFPGNFRAIEAVGARPVLVDIEAGSWCLDARLVQGALNEKTRAILVSHLHGGLGDMPRLRQLADQAGVALIEDACQTPGGEVAGRIAGAWGDVGVLSFGGSKLLSAGRGGAIVTEDESVYQRAKIFCERGNHAFPMSELQSAVLLPQLDRLDERNRTRQRNAARLIERLRQFKQLEVLDVLKPLDVPATRGRAAFYKLPWLYLPNGSARTDKPASQARSRDTFLAAAQAAGIPLAEGFRDFARRSARRCRHASELTNSRRAGGQTILLHHPVLLQPEAAIDTLADTLIQVVEADGNS